MLIESYPESILCKAVCTSSSPECCWAILSWQKMGGITSASSTNATACCKHLKITLFNTAYQNSGIPGVWCTSTGTVTEIYWSGQSLQGRIPSKLESLVNLQYL